MSGFLAKRWVKDKVQIPKKKIVNLVDAWDYAAKICLRQHRNMIRFPPHTPLDGVIANERYNFFRMFCPHNEDEIKAFESRQFQRLVEYSKGHPVTFRTKASSINDNDMCYYKMDRPKDPPLHLQVPEDAGRITKSSIALLYGSIVCTVLRQFSRQKYCTEEQEIKYAHAVYRYFSLFRNQIDDRNRRDLYQWNKIMQDKFNHGNNTHAASTLNSINTTSCKNCSNIKKNIFVPMTMSKTNDSIWQCTQCGGTEPIKRKLTTKHIRNKESKVVEEIFDIYEYMPLFREFIFKLSFWIHNIPVIREHILKGFNRFEIEANKASFHRRERYFFGHYDSTKKSKKKWCSIKKVQLTEVKIDDKRYFSEYKSLIPKIADALQQSDDMQVNGLCKSATKILAELGWLSRFVMDKIKEDVNLFLNTGICCFQ
jgi:hypothetical protein